MNTSVRRASLINIVLNFFIFIIITIIGVLFSSLSMMSKALESFFDIITALVIYFTIKLNNKKADDDHQFGHTRAENIAGYTIGVLMIVLSLTLFYESCTSLINSENSFLLSPMLLYTTLFALAVKLFLYLYISHVLKHNTSPALSANKEDHLNDVYMFIAILLGFVGAYFGFYFLDALVSIFISLLIAKSGYGICRENIDFLMGKVADQEIIDSIEKELELIKEIKSINKIKTQYLGTAIQVEVHIGLDKRLTLEKAHKISHNVQENIEKINLVEHCFVHLEDY